MSHYRNIFPDPATLIVVLHATSRAQALRNAARAFDGQAHGVFLINHSISPDALIDCYDAVRQKYADRFIGLHFMHNSPSEALPRMPSDASGLWAADAGVDHSEADAVERAREFDRQRQNTSWRGLYFGGVAFKHQRPVEDPAAAAALAAPYVDVVTTSGSATGVAASLSKISAMKRAIGDHPLAIASGITPENVYGYLGIADCFLVATGVSDTQDELDPERVTLLGRVIREFGR